MYPLTFEDWVSKTDDVFDAIIFSNSFMMLSDVQKTLRETLRIMREGSIIVITENNLITDTPHTDRAAMTRYFYQQKNVYYTIESLKYMLSKYSLQYVASQNVSTENVTMSCHGFYKTSGLTEDADLIRMAKSSSTEALEKFREFISGQDNIRYHLRKYG